MVKPEDWVKRRDGDLGHVATFTPCPPVDVVMDELDIHIGRDLWAVLFNSRSREFLVVNRVREQSVDQFCCSPVIVPIHCAMLAQELFYLLIIDDPLDPVLAVGL